MIVADRVAVKRTPVGLGWLLVFLIAGCARQEEPGHAPEEKPSLVLLHSLRGHHGGINHGALSEDGRRALSSEQKTVCLWSVDDGKELLSRNFDYRVLALAFAPHQALAITGDNSDLFEDPNLRVWDVESGKLLRCFPAPAYSAAFSPDRRRILASSGRITPGSIHFSDPCVRSWDLTTGRELGRYSVRTGAAYQVSFGWREGQVIATNLYESIYVWTAPGDKLDHQFSICPGGSSQITLSDDGRFALAASSLDSECLWDVDSGSELHTYRPIDYARPRGRDISRYRIANTGFLPDGRRALFGVASEKVSYEKPPPQREKGRPYDLNVYVKLLDYSLVMCDLKTGEELHRSGEQDYCLTFLAIAENGRRALYARYNKLQVWELPPP